MFNEFAIVEAVIALSGFVITLGYFKGAMKFLSMILLCDGMSNILYLLFEDVAETVFTANAFIVCLLAILFSRELKKRRRLL